MSVLERIIAYKREEVAARKVTLSLSDIQRMSDYRADVEPSFHGALVACTDRPALVAEIKKASPSKGVIRADFHPVQLAHAYEQGGAACLSILTDAPSFQGSEEYLADVRETSALPLLRKDFIIDPWQVGESRAYGADAILLIMAAMDNVLAREVIKEAQFWRQDVLVEVHDEEELDRALELGAKLIGVNNRSLATFETDLGITERLAARVPNDVVLVSESSIATHADITRLQRAGVRAFLVGESLMRQDDVEAATRALLGG